MSKLVRDANLRRLRDDDTQYTIIGLDVFKRERANVNRKDDTNE